MNGFILNQSNDNNSLIIPLTCDFSVINQYLYCFNINHYNRFYPKNAEFNTKTVFTLVSDFYIMTY